MDSLKGRRGANVSDPPPLTPRIPRHTNARPAVPGGRAALPPFPLLGVIELRVRFLGIRTKIHAADVRPVPFGPGSERTMILSVLHSLICGFSFGAHE